MILNTRLISRSTASVYSCDNCNAPLNHVELLNDEMRVQEDYFECEYCQKRIECTFEKDDEVPDYVEHTAEI